MIPTFCLLKPVFVFFLGICQLVFSLLYRNTIFKTWPVKMKSIHANPKRWIISFKHARVHETRGSPAKLTCFTLFFQRTWYFFLEMFHFHRLRFTKSNYLNKNICFTKFHLRWCELFSNSIALEGLNFRNSAVVISHTDKPISFSHINSGIIHFNIQVHLLDFIAWTLRNEVFPGVMACSGWTRMEEVIPMHFRPTVTWRHTMEDGPCVTNRWICQT